LELKKLIQRICREVMNFPNALDLSGVPDKTLEPPAHFDPKKYDQLVATAVLNKVEKN
jgi:hypothetical protein